MMLPVPTPPAPEIPDAADSTFSASLEDTSPSPALVGPQNGDGAPEPFFRQAATIFGSARALPEPGGSGVEAEPEARTCARARGGGRGRDGCPCPSREPERRALADPHSQGHYAEALQIYDDLVTRHPFDEDLMRMRRDAEARLLPAGQVHSTTAPDPGVERRRARIRVLESFLSRVQAG